MLYNYLIISTKKILKYENEFDKIINFFKRDNYILYTRTYNSTSIIIHIIYLGSGKKLNAFFNCFRHILLIRYRN